MASTQSAYRLQHGLKETNVPRTYTVRAVWDDDAKVWVADSDIEGLHIEADSIDAFESTLHDVAAELVAANHVTDADLHKFTARDLIPAIVFVKPEPQAA
ncbi:DUF1902 domain-containing protein [Oceaniradius stylonematis]|uniref:DUF1902 domain-containing protein n=1 Tax=Oceaniradius stylonematis TaxID=2184161 RepID=UPI00273E72CA|nr:DUF1902 domain-containing protein [Oceaniradius stylonematis]